MTIIAIVAFIFAACKKTRADEVLVYPNPATNYIIFDATSNASKHNSFKINSLILDQYFYLINIKFQVLFQVLHNPQLWC